MSKQQQWKRRIAKWQASGETQSAFSRKHRLTLATFKYWRDKILKAEKERFAEILPARVAEPFEVKLASGALIRVPANFDGSSLRNAVELDIEDFLITGNDAAN